MTKTQHRDTVDCLICELTDAFEGLAETMYAKNDVDIAMGTKKAMASIERALQLVSDLKAAQD